MKTTKIGVGRHMSEIIGIIELRYRFSSSFYAVCNKHKVKTNDYWSSLVIL